MSPERSSWSYTLAFFGGLRCAPIRQRGAKDSLPDTGRWAYGEKYLPRIKAHGALHACYVYTSDTTFTTVTIYPDEATAAAAVEKQNALRAKAATELPVSIISETRGEVFASF